MPASRPCERGKDSEVTCFLLDRRTGFEDMGKSVRSISVVGGAIQARAPMDRDEELRMADTDQRR